MTNTPPPSIHELPTGKLLIALPPDGISPLARAIHLVIRERRLLEMPVIPELVRLRDELSEHAERLKTAA